MNWQANFANSTTNIAFNLRLTKAQVAAMRLAYLYSMGEQSYAAAQDVRSLTGIDRAVPAMKEICNRGLAEHHNVFGNPPGHKWYTLTPAGILVYDMLALAGLLQPRQLLENAA